MSVYSQVVLLYKERSRHERSKARVAEPGRANGVLSRYSNRLKSQPSGRFAQVYWVELWKCARHAAKELKSPVLRFMQVEEYLKRHLGRTSRTTK